MNLEKESVVSTLYEEGRNDAEIARVIGVCAETVRNWRIKNNKPKNFKYSDMHKINVEKLRKLVEGGHKDSEIAKMLNVSMDGIYASRMRNNICRESYLENKPIKLTDFQKEAIVGILLGDGSTFKNYKNASFKSEHSMAQKEYSLHMYSIFKSLNSRYFEYKRKTPDKRNGNFYESCGITLPANPELNNIHDALYKNKKVISKEIMDLFTEVSLTYMFMDDGSRTERSISIATNCFERENLVEFCDFLYNKFGLKFNIMKTNAIYLECAYFKKFVSLIFPYLLDSMYYKIGLLKI